MILKHIRKTYRKVKIRIQNKNISTHSFKRLAHHTETSLVKKPKSISNGEKITEANFIEIGMNRFTVKRIPITTSKPQRNEITPLGFFKDQVIIGVDPKLHERIGLNKRMNDSNSYGRIYGKSILKRINIIT